MRFLVLSLALLSPAFAAEPAADEDAFEPLFDGETLAGWTALPGGSWEVVDGAIVGTSPKSEPRHGILLSDESFSDFVFRARFRSVSGNSGLYFRCEPVDHAVAVHGFQVEVDPTHATGGLYETGGRGWVVQPKAEDAPEKNYKPGEWTELEIIAKGGTITVKINGVITAHLEDDQGRAQGHFGLQLHGGDDMHVEFRDITIRTLD
jgi:hypothetical protein